MNSRCTILRTSKKKKQWLSFSHLASFVLLFSVSVKWASSIGSKPVWSQGRTHSTNIRRPWWPQNDCLGHFQSHFSTPGTKSNVCFLVLFEQAGNKLRGNASHVQIHGQNPLTGTSTHTCSFWDLVSCGPTILVDLFSNCFDIVIGTTCWRAPRMGMIFNAHFSSFEPRKALENSCTAQCFLLKGLFKNFMCFCGRFSEMETKSQADSLFGTVRHHDFARGAWQHLGELTTQARTTFHSDVRLPTDSWRMQLHSPSGGTLNYD